MKTLLLICSGLLLLALADLPIGYYTFLRIAVTIGAIAVIVTEFNGEINFWLIVFGLIVVVFNPLIPVYLHNKGSWMAMDIIAAVIFGLKAFTIKEVKS